MPPRRVLAQVLVLALLAVAGGAGLTVSAPPAAAAASAAGWTADGPGTVTAGGSTDAPRMSYDLPSAGFAERTWTFAHTVRADEDWSLSRPVSWSWSGQHAFFAVTARLVVEVVRGEGTVATTTLVDAYSAGCFDGCPPPSNGFSYSGTWDAPPLVAGDVVRFNATGSNFDSNNFLRGALQLDGVGGGGGGTWQTALPLVPGTPVQGTVATPGQALWYSFPVQPGQQVQAVLSGLPADLDLALFSDVAAAFAADLEQSRSGTPDLLRLAAQQPGTVAAPSAFSPSAFSPSAFSPSAFSPSAFSPSAFSPSAFSPSAFSPSAFSPSAFSPSAFSPSAFSPSAFSPSAFSPSAFSPSAFSTAYSSAQARSLLAVAGGSGLADRTVRANTWSAGGRFYLRVTGRNGASSPDPWTLLVSAGGGPCEGVDLRGPSGAAPPLPSGRPLVVVTDSSLLPGAALGEAVADLVSQPDVPGQVLDVAADPELVALREQARRYPSCPYGRQLLAQGLRDRLPTAGSLEYVLLLGGDDVVPFFRQGDEAGLAPESEYSPPLSSTSASAAALQNDLVLTDDPYGARTSLDLGGRTLPLPAVAVGRLVQTEAQVVAQLRHYLARRTTVPASALVTGYDFMARVADGVQEQLEAGLGGTPAERLVSPQGTAPAASWTAGQLRERLRSRHDLLFLGAHFSANDLLAADFATQLTTLDLQRDLAAAPDLLAGSLVLGAGCHNGYNIVDEDGVPGVTVGLDWPELLGGARATLISGTGYQYGDTDFLAYSGRLYVEVARALRSAERVTVGKALVAAKQAYLRDLHVLTGLDEKAVLQTTLFGVPMAGVAMPSPAAPAEPARGVSPQPVVDGPGAVLGLATADVTTDVTADAPLTVRTAAATDPDSGRTSGAYTWLEGRDGVAVGPGVPALPLQREDVTADDGAVLRGVGLWSGSYTDTPGATPLTGAAATEQSAVHAPFPTPVWFPQTLAAPNLFGALGGDGRTRLAVTPAQVRADGPTTVTLRAFTQTRFRLFYSANTRTYGRNVPSLAGPPSISDVTTDAPDGQGRLRVSARVAGDPSAGLAAVWVTYTGERPHPFHGRYDSVPLTPDADDSTLWTGLLPAAPGGSATDVRYLVQAVTGTGVLAVANDGGRMFRPGVQAGRAVPAPAATLTLSSPPSSAYGDPVPVSGRLAVGAAALPGRTVTVTLGGLTASAVTDPDGGFATTVPAGLAPGTALLAASTEGDAQAGPTSARGSVLVVVRPTALTVRGPAGPVAVDGDLGITATLTSGDRPLRGAPVLLSVLQDGSVRSQVQRTTDLDGVVRLGRLPGTPPGRVTVRAEHAVPATGFAESAASLELVTTAPTTTQVSATPQQPRAGDVVTLTARVVPAPSGGTVTFGPVGGTSVCVDVPLSAGGLATCPARVAAGNARYRADYGGATGWLPSTGELDLAVPRRTGSVALSAPPTATFGDPVVLSLSAAGDGHPLVADLVVHDGAQEVATVRTGADGTATVRVGPHAGTRSWSVLLRESPDRSGATAAATTTVARRTTATTLSVPESAPSGADVPVAVTVIGGDGGGRVDVTLDGAPGCSAAVGGDGTASCVLRGVPVGPRAVRATFSGTSDVAGSRADVALTVVAAGSRTLVSVPAVRFGAPQVLTATVSAVAPGGGVPTGTVVFSAADGELGRASLEGGTAVLVVRGVLPGTVTASYPGSPAHLASGGSAVSAPTFTRTWSGTGGGGLTVRVGEAVLLSGTLGGGLTVAGGGAVLVTGRVNGGLTASGAGQVALCGARVAGAVTVTGSTGPVQLGGSGCGVTSLSGAVVLDRNTGGLVVHSVSISGSLTLTANSGTGPTGLPPLVAASTVTGALRCTGNAPAVVDGGSPTTAGSRSGQCS